MTRLRRMTFGKETDASLTRFGACTLLLLCHAVAVHAQPSSPIVHTVRFPSPQSHYVEVEAETPTQGQPRIEVMMAVWAPGSYLVREFARNLEALTARTPAGSSLSIESSRKNRWRVDTDGAATVIISYRLYCREMSVRTNWGRRPVRSAERRTDVSRAGVRPRATPHRPAGAPTVLVP